MSGKKLEAIIVIVTQIHQESLSAHSNFLALILLRFLCLSVPTMLMTSIAKSSRLKIQDLMYFIFLLRVFFYALMTMSSVMSWSQLFMCYFYLFSLKSQEREMRSHVNPLQMCRQLLAKTLSMPKRSLMTSYPIFHEVINYLSINGFLLLFLFSNNVLEVDLRVSRKYNRN